MKINDAFSVVFLNVNAFVAQLPKHLKIRKMLVSCFYFDVDAARRVNLFTYISQFLRMHMLHKETKLQFLPCKTQPRV